MKWLKNNLVNLILILIFLVGVGLILYPSVSDYWNKLHQSRAISHYADTIAQMDTSEMDAILENARSYNAKLATQPMNLIPNGEAVEEYNAQINVGENGIMSYIEIPRIRCYLPIYHGTGEAILQIAIGHLEGTSLPVGGESTHCVLSGHRGLPSAKLFSDLDRMEVGDVFVIRTLNEILSYEVDQVLIVEPSDTDPLAIEEGKDLCTLVTCTPYGVNTHRLLVRGHRVENAENAADINVTADAIQFETIIVAPFVAIPILLILIFIVLVRTGKKKG